VAQGLGDRQHRRQRAPRLPTSGPTSDRKDWRARPKLPTEFDPILNRIRSLVECGLSSMHVLGDFLKRRIAPLQQRLRPVWIYTGPNDRGRVERGVDTDLTREALEIMVQGVTSEDFVRELLVLPARIVPLYEDQQLRTRVLRSMPTLDDGGLAARQPSGDPNWGIQIPGVQESQSRPAAVATSAAAAGANIPATSSNASNRGKQVVNDGPVPGGSSSSPSGEEERRRLRRSDGTFIGEPSTKRQRTVEAAGQGSSRTPSSHGSSVAPVPPPPPPGRSPPQ